MAQDILQNRQFEFEENQQFSRNWLIWTILIGTLLILLGTLIFQMVTGRLVGNNPASDALLIGVICFFYVPSIVAILYLKLMIRIDKDAIYYGFNLPTKDLNKINITDIATAEIVKYKFIGYGHGITKKYGAVYNTSGNRGLLITTKSGGKTLLGTHKSKDLEDTLTKLGVRHNL